MVTNTCRHGQTDRQTKYRDGTKMSSCLGRTSKKKRGKPAEESTNEKASRSRRASRGEGGSPGCWQAEEGPDRVPYGWVPYLSNQTSPSPQRQRITDRGEDQTRY